MDRVPIPISDDIDLDALMLRVRDAARAGAAGGTLATPAAGNDVARELDLIRVLEAQGEWNEHARQSFVALADGIRALRDDWAEAQAGLRREIAQLSALVERLARTRRPAAAPRGSGKGRPAGNKRARR